MNKFYIYCSIVSMFLMLMPLIKNSDTNDIEKQVIRASLLQSNYCPSGHPKAKELVERFLSSATFYENRVQTGTTNTEPFEIRVLKDSNSDDIAKCRQFNQNPAFDSSDSQIRTTVYYKADNFYFISLPLVSNTMIYKGDEVVIVGAPHILFIFNNNLKKIGSFYL